MTTGILIPCTRRFTIVSENTKGKKTRRNAHEIHRATLDLRHMRKINLQTMKFSAVISNGTKHMIAKNAV